VQVDRDVGAGDRLGQRRQRTDRADPVDRTGQQGEGLEPRGPGQREPGVRAGPAQGAHGRHGGEQVAEAERPQHQHLGAAP